MLLWLQNLLLCRKTDMNQNIIHISDVHCGAKGISIREDEIISGIQRLFTEISDPECILLVTGDIAFQGGISSYTIATRFFNSLFKIVPFKRHNVLLCPGNHDIVAEDQSYFKNFDSFAYGVRGDNDCSYSRDSVSIVSNNDILFVGINTAYRLDHSYGYVDIAELDKILKQRDVDERIKIAYFHHHILNVFEQDQSVIRNAYELLLLLDEHKFSYLFHGHQHFSQSFPLGFSRMYSFGVRTVSFTGVTGINTYKIMSDAIIYNGLVYLNDTTEYGRLGGYVCTKSFNSKDEL